MKSNNPRLSYSDTKIENSGDVRRLGFDRKWIVTIPWPPRPTVHQRVKFQHNRPIGDWVVDDLTNFHSPFFGDGGNFAPLFLSILGAIYINYEEEIGQSLALHTHLFMLNIQVKCSWWPGSTRSAWLESRQTAVVSTTPNRTRSSYEQTALTALYNWTTVNSVVSRRPQSASQRRPYTLVAFHIRLPHCTAIFHLLDSLAVSRWVECTLIAVGASSSVLVVSRRHTSKGFNKSCCAFFVRHTTADCQIYTRCSFKCNTTSKYRDISPNFYRVQKVRLLALSLNESQLWAGVRYLQYFWIWWCVAMIGQFGGQSTPFSKHLCRFGDTP